MSTINNQTDIYVSPILEPNFSWQVGFNTLGSINTGVNFRVTVRPLTTFESVSRIPHPSVLYEETGVILNGTSNLGLWQFSFAKNITTSGGPFRNYQVVVEAHDVNGNTSAGNQVGTQNENGWTAYPNGYDIVGVQNPQPSGIELSFNIPTQVSGSGPFIVASSPFATTQYMGANGDIIIKFTSGSFTSGVVGGFLYTSAIPFPKSSQIDILTPSTYYGARVQKTQFDFNTGNPFIYSPHAAFNVRGAPYCYASVAFYDEIDQELLNNGVDISTGLYLSNNTPIYNDGAAGSLSMGGVATFFTVQTTGYPAINSATWSGLVGSGNTEVARVSTDGSLNIPANLTTIFYMAGNFTGGYSGYAGGTAGGIGGNSTTNVTGVRPGGFLGTSLMITSNNPLSTTNLNSIGVGSYLYSVILTGGPITFNYINDNWQNVYITGNYGNTGFLAQVPNGISGQVQRVATSTVTGFYHLFTSGNVIVLNAISAEQPILVLTGTNHNGVVSGATFFCQVKNIQTGYYVWQSDAAFDNDAPVKITGIQFVNSPQTVYYVDVEPYRAFYVALGLNGGNLVYTLGHNGLYNY